MEIIFETEKYRIVAFEDHDWSMEELKGDVRYSIDEEFRFENRVAMEGVWGFELQKAVKYACNEDSTKTLVEYEHVDSCWGFVGLKDEQGNNHYIVDEMKQSIGA